jgi:hypothetical protein
MGQTFSVFTDNNPLTYVLTSAKVDATGHRWIAALSAYNFTITYKPGKFNADADGLSRLSEIIDTYDFTTLYTTIPHDKLKTARPTLVFLSLRLEEKMV